MSETTTGATPAWEAEKHAGFLAAAPLTDHVATMFRSDLEVQGYVANLTRVWAHSPEALGALSYVMGQALEIGRLDGTDRALITTVTAASMRDSYCSMAFGSRLARVLGDEVAAAVVSGDDSGLDQRHRALAAWTRRVVRDSSSTTPDDVDELRRAGLEDQQIYAVTLFVAMRLAFSTVNSALGAGPDAALVSRAPLALRQAVDFGRPGDADVS